MTGHREVGDLRLLRSFVAVVREGGFTQAAGVLHLTQQAVSQHVRKLERDLGVPLLHRTTRRSSLTAAGEQFFTGACAVLDDVERLWIDTRNELGGLSGVVRIGISSAAGYDIAPRLVTAVQRAHRGITVDVLEKPAAGLIADLQHARIDIGVMLGPGRDHHLTGWPLASGPLEALLSCSHPLASTTTVCPTQLTGLSLVVTRESGNRELRAISTAFARTYHLPTIESLADSALPAQVWDGTALALWPTVVPSHAVPQGLTTVALSPSLQEIGIWLLLRPHRNDRILEAVVDIARTLWADPARRDGPPSPDTDAGHVVAARPRARVSSAARR